MPDRVTPPAVGARHVRGERRRGGIDRSRWDAGRLHLDRAALVSSAAEPALAEIHLDVVRPGDPGAYRERPRRGAARRQGRRIRSGRSPERSAALAPRGRGRTNRVEGVAVLSVCDWLAAGYTTGDEFPDSFVDMDGPGARLTRWGSTTNVVMRCVPAEGAPVGDVDRAVRRASLRIARDIAATTIGAEPDAVEMFSAPALDVDPGLPAVCGDPAGRVGGSADRHVPLRARRRRDRSRRVLDPRRAAGRRVDERRVRLAGRPQRHRELPGLVAHPDAARQHTASGCGSPGSSSRSATWTRLVREAAIRDAVRAARSLARRRRGDLHHVLVRQLAHRHDADRAARASRSGSAPRRSSARRTAGSPITWPRPTASSASATRTSSSSHGRPTA